VCLYKIVFQNFLHKRSGKKLGICISAKECVILYPSDYIFISFASFCASDGSAYIQDEDVIGSTSLDKARIQHKLREPCCFGAV